LIKGEKAATSKHVQKGLEISEKSIYSMFLLILCSFCLNCHVKVEGQCNLIT